MSDIIINDDNYEKYLPGGLNVNGRTFGLVHRDMNKFPVGASLPVWTLDDLDLIPKSEWSDRIKDKKKYKSQTSDIRNIADNGKPFLNLDQNTEGYCWAYSTTHCGMLKRALMGLPYVRLSAHAVACKVKGFRDQGGWAALSLEYAAKHGIPSTEFWPDHSMNRQYDTAETWENAKLHMPTSGWCELSQPVYDRNMTFEQVATLLLNNVPVAGDFNWWGHSVAIMDLVEVEPGSFGVLILNSWRNWGKNGTAILQGSKAIPDNAVAPRAITSFGAAYV